MKKIILNRLLLPVLLLLTIILTNISPEVVTAQTILIMSLLLMVTLTASTLLAFKYKGFLTMCEYLGQQRMLEDLERGVSGVGLVQRGVVFMQVLFIQFYLQNQALQVLGRISLLFYLFLAMFFIIKLFYLFSLSFYLFIFIFLFFIVCIFQFLVLVIFVFSLNSFGWQVELDVSFGR